MWTVHVVQIYRLFFFFFNSWSLKCPNSNGNNSRGLLVNCLFILLSKTSLHFAFWDHIPIQIKATHVSFWSTIQHTVILLQFASESWDSYHSKSWVPVQNQWVPAQNAMGPNYIKRCQNSHETRQFTCTLNVWFQKISIPPSTEDFLNPTPRISIPGGLWWAPLLPGISGIFKRRLRFSPFGNSKWFWYLKTKKVSTNSVTKIL